MVDSDIMNNVAISCLWALITQNISLNNLSKTQKSATLVIYHQYDGGFSLIA